MTSVLVFIILVTGVSAQLLFDPFGRNNKNLTRCDDETDCKEGECCVHMSIHKRFLFDDLFSSLLSGVCKPLRKEGEVCVPFGKKLNIFSTNAHFALCPCASGLECTSDKKVDDHPTFGTLETHTNSMCSKPEVTENSSTTQSSPDY